MTREECIEQIAKLCCQVCEMDKTYLKGEWGCIEDNKTPCSLTTDIATAIYDTIIAPLVAKNERLKDDYMALSASYEGYCHGATADISRLKAENEELKKEKEDIRLYGLSLKNGVIDYRIGSQNYDLLVESLYQAFFQNGGENYITTRLEFFHDTGAYELTIQRVNGKTPSERIIEIEKERDTWKRACKIMARKGTFVCKLDKCPQERNCGSAECVNATADYFYKQAQEEK